MEECEVGACCVKELNENNCRCHQRNVDIMRSCDYAIRRCKVYTWSKSVDGQTDLHERSREPYLAEHLFERFECYGLDKAGAKVMLISGRFGNSTMLTIRSCQPRTPCVCLRGMTSQLKLGWRSAVDFLELFQAGESRRWHPALWKMWEQSLNESGTKHTIEDRHGQIKKNDAKFE